MKLLTRVARCLGLLTVLAVFTPLRSAPYTLSGTDVREIPVASNGQRYLLYIGLPPSYATQPTRTYPTLYVLDGYWDFGLMLPVAGNLRVDGAVPEMLTIGIGYAGDNPNYEVLRAVDLTPGADAWFDPNGTRSGKAEAFLTVIANEIIPLVEREYRADPTYRVLAGTSFAGLFTTYTAMTRPTLFQGYVACSSALWWRNSETITRASTFAADRGSPPLRLYLSYATDESTSIIDSTRQFYRQLNSHPYPGLALAIRDMEGERHSSTKPEAYARGLRFAFAPRAPRPATVGTTQRSTLANTSSRGRIGAGPGESIIAGFVIDGLTPRRVLVRAGGPALTPLGVTGVVADPQVSVHASSGALLASNDNWGGTAELMAAAALTGAYGFQPNSRDAAVMVTLPPGVYTAVAAGVNGGTGNVLVEVYELPLP